MEDLKNQFWLLKTENQVQGPLSTLTVRELISLGKIKEDDFVAAYPNGDWRSVSQVPIFYDAIMDVLSGQNQPAPADEPIAPVSDPSLKSTYSAHSLPSKVIPLNKKKQVDDLQPSGFDTTHSHQKIQNKNNETIDLNKKSVVQKKIWRQQIIWLITFFVFAASGAYYFLYDLESPVPKGRIHLLAPRDSQPQISNEDLKENLKRASHFFQSDRFRSYFSAQDILVEVVEGANKNPDALALLCLTYRELWPYSFQDSQDLAAFTKVVQMASQADPFGTKGAICHLSLMVVNGQTESMLSQLKTLLIQSPETPFLYEIRAQVFASARDYQSAIAFIQKAQQIFPQWMKPWIMEANYHAQLGQFAESKRLLSHVSQFEKNHAIALIDLGKVELSEFHQEQAGVRLIERGLDADKVPPIYLSKAHQALAVYFRKQGNVKLAIDHAKQAYEAEPLNPALKELLVQMGAEDVLRTQATSCQEMIRLGDQYMQTKAWLMAQNYYKQAFESCQPKNALVAMKAAEALWLLGQSTEALLWLEKGLAADPGMTLGTYRLADYLSQRFEFERAFQYLRAAQAKYPKSTDVLRGFALVELRRRNYKDAILFCEKGFKIFENDLETHFIMIKALNGAREFEKAFRFAARAIEIDRSNFQAQGLYAEALAGFQGVDQALKYLRNLITQFPSSIEYRFSYAKVLQIDDRFEDMINVLDQTLKMDPNNKEIRILMGQTQLHLQKFNEALDLFLTVISLDPTDPVPFYLIGEAYLSKEKYSEALQYFEKAEGLNPKYPKVRFSMAKSLLGMGDLKRALQEVEQEKKLNPQLSDAFLLAGEIYMQLAKNDSDGQKNYYKKATEEFQKALRLRVQKAPVYVLLARAHRLSGQNEIALTMLNMATSQESGLPEIFKERGLVYSSMQQSEQALAAYQIYLELLPNASDRSEIEKEMARLKTQQ